MNTTINSFTKRQLFVDFDMYADNDPDFKKELVILMIDNLNELYEAYGKSVKQNDPSIFSKACHKVKTTLVMLEDPEFNGIVEALGKPHVDPIDIRRFGDVIGGLIESLAEVK